MTIAAQGLRLAEDWHVHSTFSDGADPLEANIAAAESLHLSHLGCVDHVRADTTYVPDYVAAVRAARERTGVNLSIGIEAKILDRTGTLDLPDARDGVELVYVADHQFPSDNGPMSPRVMRDAVAQNGLAADAAIDALVSATISVMTRYAAAHRLVLAHLFSILPKIGLDESAVPDSAIDALARQAAETGTIVEVSERWRCPSARVISRCLAHGVKVVASTDSHRVGDIARYDYVSTIAALGSHHG